MVFGLKAFSIKKTFVITPLSNSTAHSPKSRTNSGLDLPTTRKDGGGPLSGRSNRSATPGKCFDVCVCNSECV